jgi:hypothetical protein
MIAGWHASNLIIPRFVFCGFSQAHSGTTPVLVDEFDAGGFQGSTNREVIRSRHRSLTINEFSTSDGCNPDRGLTREILSAPSNQRPSSSDLGACQKAVFHVDF